MSSPQPPFLASAFETVRLSFIKAGVPEGDLEEALKVFFTGDVLPKAARRYSEGLLQEALPLIFTEEKRLELLVDYSISPEVLLTRSGQDPNRWEYLGHRPFPGRRHETLVIGHFNKRVSGTIALEWLRRDGHFIGSGAWVREEYLLHYPSYDRESSMAFPDETTSLWREPGPRDGACFPGLWHDYGRGGVRSWDFVGNEWRAGSRFVFLVKP